MQLQGRIHDFWQGSIIWIEAADFAIVFERVRQSEAPPIELLLDSGAQLSPRSPKNFQDFMLILDKKSNSPSGYKNEQQAANMHLSAQHVPTGS